MMIADLHIHSKYSRATSRDSVPEMLELWARRKGIHLLGSGDFTHPAWREELREKLVPAEEGLYRLRNDLRQPDRIAGEQIQPRFVLSGEISSIYKKNGRTRKVHNVILLPSLDAAETLSKKLEAIGNIHSDGRPILGLDSRDLLEITLEACPEAVFIPAHIWTPHFSLFGAFSGFDTIEECFGDLTPYIHAVETGLSSDPPMNWRVSALDKYTLVSHSDAHSPAKLGREANLLDIPMSYQGLSDAIQGKKPENFWGTIEFFPEEGKYHYDGHRNCNLCLKPADAERYQGICPVCGKKLTIGVEHRVEQLADRPEGASRENAKPFESLAPLPEVIAACTGASPNGVSVQRQYRELLEKLGNEFYILREASVEQLQATAGPCVAEGIRRLRRGEVERIPGYDGEYGEIRLLSEDEREAFSGQTSLFAVETLSQQQDKEDISLEYPAETIPEDDSLNKGGGDVLNREQQEAVEALEPVTAVIAGPGTGKTKTLVSRIAYLIETRGVKPSQITAVTFTNKAANEMRQRLEQRLGGRKAVRGMTIGTFHSICLQRLSQRGPVRLIDESAAMELAAEVLKESGEKGSARDFLGWVSQRKNGLSEQKESYSEDAFQQYEQRLHRFDGLDFDDLLTEEWKYGEESSEKRGKANPFAYLLVDEFQDINPIQYRLIRQWAKGGKSLFVIGDPDQAIYGFRGADADCFGHLQEECPSMRTIRLVQNYRSTPEIISCAMAAIASNPGDERELMATKPADIPVRLITAASDLSEGIFIAKEINKMVGGIDMLDANQGKSADRVHFRGFSEIGILYRTHRQADLLEKCLQREGIPYVVAGRDDFLADELVQGSLDFFRFLLNPLNIAALSGCLSRLWKCPKDIILSLKEEIEKKFSDGIALGAEQVEELSKDFSDRPHLNGFFQSVRELLPMAVKGKPWKLLETLTGYAGISGEPLDKLQRTAIFYKSMGEFLEALTLGQESDLARSASARKYDSGAVTLMTLHGSKGLEFPAVFLCGVKKGTLPLESVRGTIDAEEERRLFYVGITRAQEELVVLTRKEESSFLSEIPSKLFQREAAEGAAKANREVQLSFF